MNQQDLRRPAISIALLVTAILGGAFAGLTLGVFIWVIEEAAAFVWSSLPDAVGVSPFDSWWLFAVPVVGGALVGLGQMLLGNYPLPLEAAIETWKRGDHIEPDVAPRTAVNSVFALAAGGPVGFEAALTGILGGTATWIGARLDAVDRLVRRPWPANGTGNREALTRKAAGWVAAIAGLITYRNLPFGEIDLGFRFSDFDGAPGFWDGLAAFVFAALIVVPAAWAINAIGRAEVAVYFRRSPVVAGMAGGLAIALLAAPSELVLFSGQGGIQLLPDTGTGELVYVAIAKWLALVIALLAGWRGGPIFPIYTSIAAIAVVVADGVDVGADIMIVAGIAAAGVVFLKGKIVMAALLTLYPVALTYTSVIFVGCLGAALGLVIARSVGAIPAAPSAD